MEGPAGGVIDGEDICALCLRSHHAAGVDGCPSGAYWSRLAPEGRDLWYPITIRRGRYLYRKPGVRKVQAPP